MPVGFGSCSIETNDQVIPRDFVSIGDVVGAIFISEDVPIDSFRSSVEFGAERGAEALDDVVVSLELTIYVERIDDAITGTISHLAAETTNKFIDDEGV